MTFIHGFAPLARADARILILGSMPSRESLLQQRYYAHSRNSFWPIMASLLDFDEQEYQRQADWVMQARIAVWDVLQTCFRSGSLDSAIDDSTIVTNDFCRFYADHTKVERVFFNGAKAESIYLREVLPGLQEPAASLPLQRLPSTSPAHAGMNLQQKREAWSMILE